MPLILSVTHNGLHGLGKKYLQEVITQSDGLEHITVYVFTEQDTIRIVEEIIVPAASYYLKGQDGRELLRMFGVDGEYGRHYSFLKAISAFWNILLDQDHKSNFQD